MNYPKKKFSFELHKSRIMVAGGGGGSEWIYSISGLSGGKSFSAKSNDTPKNLSRTMLII